MSKTKKILIALFIIGLVLALSCPIDAKSTSKSSTSKSSTSKIWKSAKQTAMIGSPIVAASNSKKSDGDDFDADDIAMFTAAGYTLTTDPYGNPAYYNATTGNYIYDDDFEDSGLPYPPGTPGFESIFAITGLIAVAYLVLARRD